MKLRRSLSPSRRLAVPLALACALFGARADAALTSSEKAQIKDYVSAGKADSAARVRALVARTDLSAEEAAQALAAAYVGVPFDAPRARLLREVVFGPASAASRPLLVPTAVRALVARADAVLASRGGALERGDERVADELFAIYAFLDREIAGGDATGGGHEPSLGVPAQAYEDAALVVREHVERNARWLKGEGRTSEPAAIVRAQAQRMLIDLMPDGVTRFVEASTRLGLRGTRQKLLVTHGILVQDAGALDDAALARVATLLEQLPPVRRGLALVYVGEDRRPLVARGAVVQTGGMAGPDAEKSPFTDEVSSVTVDPLVAGVALDLATIATRRALDEKKDLLARATADAAATGGDKQKLLGRPRAPSVEHVLGAATALLLIDAPRAVDLAMVRFLQGKPESVALLSDALGVLAHVTSQPNTREDKVLTLGKEGGTSAATGTVQKLDGGAAVAFTVEGHRWTLDREAGGLVRNVRHDAEPLTLAHLGKARTPLTTAERWADGDLVFVRLRGAPAVGIVPAGQKSRGPTVKMRGGAPKGYDAIGTTPPAADVVVEGDVVVRGGTAGIAVRAENGRSNLEGVVLLLDPEGKASLVAIDANGAQTPLAESGVSGTFPMRMRLEVKGTNVEVTLGASTLRGTAERARATGDVALVASKGADVEVRELRMSKAR